MTTAFSWFLALRYLLSRWVNVLGMGGVALAVWALIVVVAVFTGFIDGIRDNIRNGAPDLLLTGLPDDSSFAALESRLEADPDVAANTPRLRHYGLYYVLGRGLERIHFSDALATTGIDLEYVELVGIDQAREPKVTRLRAWLEETLPQPEDLDRPLDITAERYERLQHQLGVESNAERTISVRPGLLFGQLRARRSAAYQGQDIAIVTGRVDPQSETNPLQKVRRVFTLTGVFESKHRVLDQTAAMIDIEELRSIVGHDRWDPASIDVVTDVAIRARDGADLDAVAERLSADLADTGGHVLTWREQNELFLGVVDQERGMMKLILLAISLVAGFLIYATMHMMVTQKTKDIGIMSAVGASRGGIGNVFLICGIVIGSVGCALGAIIGCLTAAYLDEIDRGLNELINWGRSLADLERIEFSLFPRDLYALDRIPTVIEPAWVTQVVVGAFIVTLLAAWLPARRAARFEPVKALGYE